MKDQPALQLTPVAGEKTVDYPGNFCLHCGNDVPEAADIYGGSGLFCCNGCKFVYNLLHELGLDDFYELRDENRLFPVTEVSPGQEFSYLDLDNFKKIYRSDEHEFCMKYYVDGISCAACLWLIEKAGDIIPEIESVSLNMSNNVATVIYRDDNSYSRFPETVKKFGFKTYPISAESESGKYKLKENRSYLYRIGVAGVCAGNIMLLSAAGYSGASGDFAAYFDLISLLLSVPVVLYSSTVFYKNSYYAIKNRRPSVDIPVVFVIVTGWVLSVVNFTGMGEVYFDSVSLFVFLLLGSRYVLNNMRDRINGLRYPGLSPLSDKKVNKWVESSDSYEFQPLFDVKPGDLIKLERGDRSQVDGFLASDKAHLNLSVLTGESIPQFASRGDYVYAGTVIDSEEALIRVDKTYETSRIGRLLKGIEDRNILKSGYSGMSDSYSTVFTVIVAVISVISFPAFYYFYDAGEAFRRVIAFVLISCPCAFVFTLPITITYSLKSALSRGIVIKDMNILEKVSGVGNIFFDKTGTLTSGEFAVLEWDTGDMLQEDIDAVVAIQKKSGHPIARSMVNYFSNWDIQMPEVREFQYIPAGGVSGIVNNDKYEIFSESCEDFFNSGSGQVVTRLSVFKNNRLITTLFLGDRIKSDAREVVKYLISEGYSVHIISGDKATSVQQTSDYLGIPDKNRFWEMTPEQKMEIVGSSTGSMVVGDGINDAGAISEADVGVSIQGCIEESLRLSDVYLLRNDLTSVKELISHCVTTGNTVYRTIAFSVVYNLTAGIFALLGYINPLVAAVLMPTSSVLLVLLSLHMQRNLGGREYGNI